MYSQKILEYGVLRVPGLGLYKETKRTAPNAFRGGRIDSSSTRRSKATRWNRRGRRACGMRRPSRRTRRVAVREAVPQLLVPLFDPFFGWEGSPTKIDCRESWYPYSNLSTGGPGWEAERLRILMAPNMEPEC